VRSCFSYSAVTAVVVQENRLRFHLPLIDVHAFCAFVPLLWGLNEFEDFLSANVLIDCYNNIINFLDPDPLPTAFKTNLTMKAALVEQAHRQLW